MNIQSWIRRITDSEMPIFGRTVQEVISVSEDDDSSASQLGQVVLKDAAMTSRVLKLANSSYYNPGRQHFSTISRAIMMLGFDTVRSMCLTVALIDSLVQGIHRDHLVREMARSLHAASQAQLIAVEQGDRNPEEVFISTLLYHIGDLAFWCFAEEEGERLDAALRKPDSRPEQAQRRILGFTLQELSQGLAKEWALSDLLQDTLHNPAKAGDRSKAILASHQLAEATEKGWETDAVRKLIREMADLAGLDEAAMAEKVHHTARQAVETSAYYGAQAVSKVIPLPQRFAPDQVDDSAPCHSEFPEPDPGLQLKILRELTSLMTTSADFNMVVEMILEGIQRGVGMDRALFALLSPDRKELRPKFVLGDPDDQLREAFRLDVNSDATAPVRHVLATGDMLWVHADSGPEVMQHITDAFTWITGTESLLLAPVTIKGRPIGVFYADRAPSRRMLDQECSDSFRHFTQQANLVLNHLAGRA